MYRKRLQNVEVVVGRQAHPPNQQNIGTGTGGPSNPSSKNGSPSAKKTCSKIESGTVPRGHSKADKERTVFKLQCWRSAVCNPFRFVPALALENDALLVCEAQFLHESADNHVLMMIDSE